MTITNYLGVGQKGCKLEGAHLGASGDLTVLCDLGCDLYRYLLCIYIAATAKSLQSCLTLCDPMTAAHEAPPSWDSPGKNTGVGCHFLLQCMKVKSESEVAQSCPTLSDPMDCSLPGSSIHGIFQARVLEWGAIALSDIYVTCHNKNYKN